MAAKSKTYETGILCVLTFVVLGALQEVYVGNLVQNYDPIWVMTITFAIAMFYFNVFALKQNKFEKTQIANNIKIILGLNFTTALSWFGFMISLKWLEPAIVSCICFSLGPILTALFNPIANKRSKVYLGEYLSAIGMFAGVLLLSYSSLSGYSGLGLKDFDQTLSGLVAAILSAIGIMGNTFCAKKMSRVGFNTIQTMALRFYLLIVLGIATLWINESTIEMTSSFTGEMLGLSILTVILPLYLLQVGIERLEPITVSLLISSMPVLTYFLQMFDQRLTPSLYSLAGVSICFFASVFGVFVRFTKETSAQTTVEGTNAKTNSHS